VIQSGFAVFTKSNISPSKCHSFRLFNDKAWDRTWGKYLIHQVPEKMITIRIEAFN
jgi:hypothetical protein